MLDLVLTYNGRVCGSCGGCGGIPVGHFGTKVRCPDCHGIGRAAIPVEDIIAAHVEEALRKHWPERRQRWGE